MRTTVKSPGPNGTSISLSEGDVVSCKFYFERGNLFIERILVRGGDFISEVRRIVSKSLLSK